MRHCRSWSALLIVLATTVSLAQSVAPTRDVQLALTLPNDATPVLRIADGETGTVELPRIGKFGFVPRIQDSNNVVVVDVFDLNATPHKRLGRLEAVIGGDRVQSKTKPDFGVRVTQIISR
jgi:hypothetical protein